MLFFLIHPCGEAAGNPYFLKQTLHAGNQFITIFIAQQHSKQTPGEPIN